MKRKSTQPTMEAIEELLDRKLDQKLDEKLFPIKKDIPSLQQGVSLIREEIAEVKHVIEHKVYKEMKEGFERVDEVLSMVIEDRHELKTRVSRLEKHTGIDSS